MYDKAKWDVWLYNAISSIPSGVSLGDAIKMEEILRELVAKLNTTGL